MRLPGSNRVPSSNMSIAQAAQSLGASGWTVFRRIELPLILPGVAGGWLIAFINSFDELTMSIFVASASTQTLPVKMYNHIAHTIDPLLASISTVLIVLTLVLMMVLDEAHILNISVCRSRQGCGLGRQLLQHLGEVARKAGGSQILLEVRPSNESALALYRKVGFEMIGRRKGYYPACNGREDALVMRLPL